MEHPWIFVASVILSAPLIRWTLGALWPNFGEELIGRGESFLRALLEGGFRASWALSKLPVVLLVSAVHIAFIYNLAVWLFL